MEQGYKFEPKQEAKAYRELQQEFRQEKLRKAASEEA